MGENAARLDDPVSHGGNIVTGSLDVFTEGQPSARFADMVVCALHGVALVAETSQTVFVNGKGFARKGDGCICAGGAGTAGPGQQDIVLFILSTHGAEKTLEQLMEERPGHGPHLEALLRDANQDGAIDSLLVAGSVVEVDLQGEHGRFAMSVFGGEAEAANIRGRYAIDGFVPLNQTVRAKASAHALRTEGALQLGDEARVEGKGRLFSADAEAELLVGDDGQRVGVIARGGAKASAVSGEGRGVVDTTAGGFLGRLATTNPGFAPLALGASALGSLSPQAREVLATPVKLEAAIGGAAAAVGLDGAGEAYYDRHTEEAVIGVEGWVAAVLGLGFDLKLTVGGKDAPPAAEQAGGAGPNLIVDGAATVFVGE